jgi:hypothetical protein
MTLRVSAATVGLLAAATALRLGLVDAQHEARRTSDVSDDVLGSPGAPLLAAVTFEHSLAVADMTWLSIVQELGRPNVSGIWDRVTRWTDIAVDLDRRYFTVYHSVGINLSVYAQRVDDSDRLVLRGYRELPHRWELPMILGYNAYFVRGDAALGSMYIAEAAKLPRAPVFLAPLAGRMRFHGGDELGAISLLEEMALSLEGAARDEIMSRIALLKSEPRLQAYDVACKQYEQANGHRPTAQQLHEQGVVPFPPQDYLDNPITFDDSCIARTAMTKVREFEARARVGSQRPTEAPTHTP